MSERVLASIREIGSISSIEGADNIVVATIDGWEVVTQKSNNFKPGDKVVYFEVDSVLPVQDRFEFLRKNCYVSSKASVYGEGFRIKIIRLRGQYSQGLILPIDQIEEVTSDMEVGTNLTDLIGVVKYERPLPANLGGVARGNFPIFIPKTDQNRIQNIFYRNEKNINEMTFEETQKIDGSSGTYYYKADEDRFGVCSRNLDLEFSEDNTFWKMAIKYDIESKLRSLGRSIAIQGEIAGEGIQGNSERLDGVKYLVFDVFDIDSKKYLLPSERRDFVNSIGLEHVPVINENASLLGKNVAEIVLGADGKSVLNNSVNREGLVYKSNSVDFSFKAISQKWLYSNEG